jgi:hypothetical protein
MAASCKDGNEAFGFIKGGDFQEELCSMKIESV